MNLEIKKTFTLKDIAREYYYEKKAKGDTRSSNNEIDEEDKIENFYQQRVKDFREIIHTVNLDIEMKKLKKINSDNYIFDIKGREFILKLFREHAGKLDPLRRGEIYKLDSEIVLCLYNGFLHIFQAAGADKELIRAAASKMSNRLDVPMRILKSERELLSKNLENMIKNKMTKETLGMNVIEQNIWLIGMRQDLYALIKKWDELYSIMAQIRQMELNEQIYEDYEKIGADEESEARIGEKYSGEILKAWKNDKIICQLTEKLSKLIGIPVEVLSVNYKDVKFNNKKFKYKKKKFVKDIEKEVETLREKLYERQMLIRTQTIRKYIPDYEMPSEIKMDRIDFSKFKSAEELLKEAIEEQKENWKLDESREEINLPKKSFDKIERELDKLPPVGNLGYFFPNRKKEKDEI